MKKKLKPGNSLMSFFQSAFESSEGETASKVVWSIKEADGICWDCHFDWKRQ